MRSGSAGSCDEGLAASGVESGEDEPPASQWKRALSRPRGPFSTDFSGTRLSIISPFHVRESRSLLKRRVKAPPIDRRAPGYPLLTMATGIVTEVSGSAAARPRVAYLDILRGVAMVLMAI